MANVRMLCWNIQVYGPEKYGRSENNETVARIVAEVVAFGGINVVVVMELMSSVAEQIAFTLCETCAAATGKNWSYGVVQARTDGDRESYAVLYRTGDGAPFAAIADGFGLGSNDFPNNFSGSHGRKPVYAWLRTGDTGKNVVVSGYHAPPNQQSLLGVERLGQMPEIYKITSSGSAIKADARMLGGDYNLDLAHNTSTYKWLTNPVPASPPPSAAGQGAGTVAGVSDNTILGTYNQAVAEWGDDITMWSKSSGDYRQKDNCIDNIFAAPKPNSSVTVDVLSLIMTHAGVSRYAQKMVTQTRANAPAFPHAELIEKPLNKSLTQAGYAFLLYRYAISDHLPIFAEFTV